MNSVIIRISTSSLELHKGFTINLCYRSSGDSDAASTAAVETTLERLRGTRGALEELWSDRERRLELTLQLRHFERDALEVSVHSAHRRSLFTFRHFQD